MQIIKICLNFVNLGESDTGYIVVIIIANLTRREKTERERERVIKICLAHRARTEIEYT